MALRSRVKGIIRAMVEAHRPINMQIWSPEGYDVWILSPGVQEDPKHVFASIQFNMESLARKYYPKLSRSMTQEARRQVLEPVWTPFVARCMEIYDIVAAQADVPVRIHTDIGAYPRLQVFKAYGHPRVPGLGVHLCAEHANIRIKGEPRIHEIETEIAPVGCYDCRIEREAMQALNKKRA